MLAGPLNRYMGVRLNITLSEPEPPHRSVVTQITWMDIVKRTITVADPPAWSGATIVSPVAATFSPSGIVGGVQAIEVAPPPALAPVSGSGNDAAINANFAELAATLNAMIKSLRDAKLMA